MSAANKAIDADRAAIEFGISQHHEQMANGECRFRLKQKSGSGYIFTISGDDGGWQKSHSHRHITEIYMVEAGWMAIAMSENGVTSIAVYREGDVVQVNPRVPHNAYLPKGACIHTVKVGSQDPHDWIPEPQLDDEVCNVPESELLD